VITRLYVGEDAMDGDLVAALRDRGVDVLTAEEAGMIGRSDDDHLEYPGKAGRVLYSFNIRHYFRLHVNRLSRGESHAGIVVAPQQQYTVGEQMRRLLRLVAARSAEEMKNQIEHLGAWD
jgi:hypothetical protein